MADEGNTKALLLQIDANVALLKSNLGQADAAVAAFAKHTEERLEIVDLAFEKVGDKVAEHGAEIGGAIAGIFAVEALTEAIEKGLEYAAALGEVAQQLGVTARDLQVFRYAASQVGISTEEMDKGLQKFTKSLGEARAGSEASGKIFKAIGFTDDQIKHLDVHDALLKTADGISAIGDRATRAVPETTLFGRAGQQLDTLFAGGSKGIDAFAASAEKLGLIIPDEFLEKAARAEHTVSELKQVLSVNIANAVAQNADAITTLAHALEAVAVGAAHAVQRLTGFITIYHSEGLIAALAADGKTKDEAGSSEGNLKREYGNFQEARQKYLASPTSKSQQDSYSAAIKNLKNAALAVSEEKAEAAAAAKLAAQQGTGNGLGGVLAPKGPKGKSADELAKEAEEARKREVDRQKRVADQDARLDDEYLSARSSVTASADEQARLARERLAADTAAKLADLKSQVADGRVKPGAEEDGIRQRIQRNDQASGDVINQRLNIQHEQDAFTLANAKLDILRDELGSQEALATTMRDRRRIEQQILEAEKENERKRLQEIADDRKRPVGERHYSDEAHDEADAGLKSLNERYAGKGAVIDQQTASPLEAARKQLTEAVGDTNTTLQQLQVNVVDQLGDKFASTAQKALHLHGVLGNIAGDLIKIAEQKLELALFGGSGGGGFLGKLFGGGHADGGPVNSSQFYLVGERGPELFAPSGNGNIIPNHSLSRNIVPARTPSAEQIGRARQETHVHVHVGANELFDARVASISGSQIDQAAPSLVAGGAHQAFRDGTKRQRRQLPT